MKNKIYNRKWTKMNVSIWNKRKEVYMHKQNIEHIYNDTIVEVKGTLKPAFAIEKDNKKTYYDKEYYVLDFIHDID